MVLNADYLDHGDDDKGDEMYSRQDYLLPELILKGSYSAGCVYPIEDLIKKSIPTQLELVLKIFYCEPVSFLVFILRHYKPDKMFIFLLRNARKESNLNIKWKFLIRNSRSVVCICNLITPIIGFPSPKVSTSNINWIFLHLPSVTHTYKNPLISEEE